MKIFSIYKISNIINNKCYIGFTSKNPAEKRWKEHTRRAFNNKEYKTDRKHHIHRAIQKYGSENFIFEIICQSLDGEYCRNILEQYFIDMYDSHKNGYNETPGGGMELTEDIIKRRSESLKNRYRTDTKLVERQSKNSRDRWLNPEYRHRISLCQKGKKLSEETKRKISEHHKGRKMSDKQKKLISENNKKRPRDSFTPSIMAMKKSRAHPCIVDGIHFSSKREAATYISNKYDIHQRTAMYHLAKGIVDGNINFTEYRKAYI